MRVHASTVSTADARIRGMRVPFALILHRVIGMRRPHRSIPDSKGGVFSAEVVEVGGEVTRWQVGARGRGRTGMKRGTHAESVAVAEDAAMARGPADLGHEEAATLPF